MTDREFITESIIEQINKRESKSINAIDARLIYEDTLCHIYTIEFKDEDKVRRFKAIGVSTGWNLTELK